VLEPRVLFFNRALFARAGLDPARAPETWADLERDAASIERLARRTRLSGVHGLGLGAAGSERQFEDFMPLAWGNGGDILSADLDSSRFDSPENRGALAFYLRLRKAAASGSGDTLDHEFAQGRLGLLCAAGTLAARLPPGAVDFGVARIPRPPDEDGRHAAIANGGVLASFRGSRQKEAALRLARFLVAPDRVVAVTAGAAGVLPANLAVDSSLALRVEPRQGEMLRQLEDLHFPPNHAAWDSMRLAIEDGLASACGDSLAPPESAAARATAAVDRRLVELMGGH
jgi:multiple sugar transport system substrate-binding protein